jgi:CPA2 family monovalent cation:H+ antiporter-2
MDHSPALLETIAIGLVAAFAGGVVASRIGLPTIVGYLLAGVAVGPFTPGLVADTGTAQQLAELGVILLMFGVGIHFSIPDLLAVRSVAIPGAVGQITVATLLGVGLGVLLGWGPAGGLVLGLAVSVASTIVLLRALEARDELDSPQGRVAVGWLIVEDLFTVLVLVLLPTLAPMLLGQGGQAIDVLAGLGLALVKLGTFAALMLIVGVRVVPRLLEWVQRTGSRELFTLSVLAVAIGIAVAAYALFGVSFALGAFLAGVVLNESEVSHRAAEDALPLRDAFAVLFFVSVGMLFDPGYLVANPVAVLLVTLLVVGAKSVAAFLIVVALRRPLRVALTVAVALSQVGEFSFILATLALSLALIPEDAFQLVVAAALVSITCNTFLFRAVEPAEAWIRARPRLLAVLDGGRGGAPSDGAAPEAA